jgi:hypothetical protein
MHCGALYIGLLGYCSLYIYHSDLYSLGRSRWRSPTIDPPPPYHTVSRPAHTSYPSKSTPTFLVCASRIPVDMNDPLCHPIPTLPISRPQPRRPHLTHKAIPPPDSILHQPSRSTTRSQCPTAEASGWRQASGAESDDDDMDGNGEDEYGDEGEARGCGWRSDEDSEETHDSSISSRDSRDSAVLMTPPVMVPRVRVRPQRPLATRDCYCMLRNSRLLAGSMALPVYPMPHNATGHTDSTAHV